MHDPCRAGHTATSARGHLRGSLRNASIRPVAPRRTAPGRQVRPAGGWCSLDRCFPSMDRHGALRTGQEMSGAPGGTDGAAAANSSRVDLSGPHTRPARLLPAPARRPAPGRSLADTPAPLPAHRRFPSHARVPAVCDALGVRAVLRVSFRRCGSCWRALCLRLTHLGVAERGLCAL